MPKIYSREDAGAPDIAYVARDYNRAGFVAIKLVLKACLVFGYGSKAAAGWELINEGDNFLVLHNGAHTGYVCLTLVGSATLTVYLSETYTGMSGDVMLGDGVKSGTAGGSTIPQRLGLWAPAYSAAGSCWYVVADEQTFILQMAGSGGYGPHVELAITSTQFTAALYVGNDSAGNFVSMGGTNIASTAHGDAIDHFCQLGFTALKNPSTGFLVGTGSLNVRTPSLHSPGTSNEATITKLDKVPLSRPVWCEVTTAPGLAAGEFRGIVQTPGVMAKYMSRAAQSLGFSGVLTCRNMNTPINLGDGFQYLMGGSYAANNFVRLVTNNPEFW